MKCVAWCDIEDWSLLCEEHVLFSFALFSELAWRSLKGDVIQVSTRLSRGSEKKKKRKKDGVEGPLDSS